MADARLVKECGDAIQLHTGRQALAGHTRTNWSPNKPASGSIGAMPTVEFAPALTRHVACQPQRVTATTLRQALESAFDAAPAMRAYVLDEQGAVRKHVAVFVNAATPA